MILAAGRGERMRPLSDALPKALLEVAGKPLIVRHLEHLARAGLRDVVINHAHLGHLIEAALGDGSAFGVRIQYSREERALGTAGGIVRALQRLGPAPFLVVSADIFCDYDFTRLLPIQGKVDCDPICAYLVMVDNPPHHPHGDFVLAGDKLALAGGARLNYGNIGIYHPALFAEIPPGRKAELGLLLRAAIARGAVRGEHYGGAWVNVGTPEQLQALNRMAGAELTQRNEAGEK